MNVKTSSIANLDRKHSAINPEPVDRQLNIQILARCIGTALNLGSPLKIEVHYAPQTCK